LIQNLRPDAPSLPPFGARKLAGGGES